MWDYRARLDRVIDGDTIQAEIDKGMGDESHIEVRLFGVYAPESTQPGGPETREYVRDWFLNLPEAAWPFVVTTLRMKQTDREQMTFTRYVAMVTSLDGSRSLNADVTAWLDQHDYPRGIGG